MTPFPTYIQSIALKNVRSFGHEQEILFWQGDKIAMWNILIGDNGVGKTTVLRAIALLLFSSYGEKKWLKLASIDSFIRTEESPASLCIYLISPMRTPSRERIEIKFNFETKLLNYAYHPKLPEQKLPIFGYGAARKIGRKGMSAENDFPAISLFEEDETLMNVEEWLILADYKAKSDPQFITYRDTVIAIIKTILQEEELTNISFDVKNTPRVLFHTKFGVVPLHELSLGYKTLLAWIVDFAKGMLDQYPQSANPLAEPAICLIDEIDLHIHPALQKKVIYFLRETFKQTQFIVTSHSPLIIQAVEDANIIVLTDKNGEVQVTQNPIDVRTWRTDQILMSDLFGLQSVRAADIDKKIERRRDLLRKGTRTPNEEEELNSLEKMTDSLPIGDNQAEIKGFDLLKQLAESLGKK